MIDHMIVYLGLFIVILAIGGMIWLFNLATR